MVLRAALFTGLVLSLMGMVANGTILSRYGVTAGCTVLHSTSALQLQSCHAGWFKGYPNLSSRGCQSVGITARKQYWSCPIR